MAVENTHFYQILQAIHFHANHNLKTRGLVGQLYVQSLNWTHTDLRRAAAHAKGSGGWGREEPQRRRTRQVQTEGCSITTSPALLPRTLPVMILPGASWLQKMSVPCRRGEGEGGGERAEHLSVYKI